MIVIKLSNDGTFEEVYNGPGVKVWELLKNKPLPKNGQYQISLSKLSKIMSTINPDDIVKPILDTKIKD